MSPESAIRRLLKSRLRLRVLKSLVTERASESWASLVEVEEGISKEAWAAWVKVRAAHVEFDVQDSLQAAILATRAAFDGVIDREWLDSRIQSFVEDFRIAQLTEGECISAMS